MNSLKRIRSAALAALIALAFTAAAPSGAQEKPEQPGGPSITAVQTISSDPLDITVNDNTSVAYELNGNQMYFGPSDSGTFLTIDGLVFGPEPLANQGFEPVAYTLVSNTLSGTGTAADPFVVQTRVEAGATGIALIQTISYVAGEQDYDIRLRLENSNPAPVDVRMIHAADMYVNFPDNDPDFGYGFRDFLSGAIGSVARNGQFVQTFLPSEGTPPTAYQVSDWGRGETETPFWNYIGGAAGAAGPGLQNIIDVRYIDVVAGFQWDLTIPGATPDAGGPGIAAAGAVEVGASGAFGPASDFDIRTNAVFLPVVVR